MPVARPTAFLFFCEKAHCISVATTTALTLCDSPHDGPGVNGTYHALGRANATAGKVKIY
jgi:hypothetical protein